MKAIILAAGRGTRMMPFTADRPKPLLQIDKDNTVLDIQLKKLQRTPVDEIVIVGGYMSDMIEKKVKTEYPKMNIKVIYNPFYDITNNFVSLWMAKHNMDEPFIVINGDDVFQSTVINDLVEKTKRREVVMVIDRKEKYDEDDMKVITKGNNIAEVSKKIDVNAANGESIGMIKFEGAGITKLKKVIEKLIRVPENRDVFWLKSIQELINEFNNVEYFEIKRDQWEEIDFTQEYARLRDEGKKRFYFDKEKNPLKKNIFPSKISQGIKKIRKIKEFILK